GYFGGNTDWTIMTLVNVMLTFPFVLLALAVIAVLGPNLINMILVLGAAGWPIYARVVRAETLAIREREFVLAGRALGMSHARLVFRQILPNLVSVIVVIATLQVAQVIILESFLSFLGLGGRERGQALPQRGRVGGDGGIVQRAAAGLDGALGVEDGAFHRVPLALLQVSEPPRPLALARRCPRGRRAVRWPGRHRHRAR